MRRNLLLSLVSVFVLGLATTTASASAHGIGPELSKILADSTSASLTAGATTVTCTSDTAGFTTGAGAPATDNLTFRAFKNCNLGAVVTEAGVWTITAEGVAAAKITIPALGSATITIGACKIVVGPQSIAATVGAGKNSTTEPTTLAINATVSLSSNTCNSATTATEVVNYDLFDLENEAAPVAFS
jgi:hypothetical protein